MLPFGVTIPATVPQGSEIPEGLTNNPVYIRTDFCALYFALLYAYVPDSHKSVPVPKRLLLVHAGVTCGL